MSGPWNNRVLLGFGISQKIKNEAKDIAKGSLAREYLLEHPGATFTIDEDVRRTESGQGEEYFYSISPREE